MEKRARWKPNPRGQHQIIGSGGESRADGDTLGSEKAESTESAAEAPKETAHRLPRPATTNIIMWFLQVLFIFACFLGLFSVISYLLRHYGSAVKVYLIQTDRVPRSSKDSSWAKAERKRVLDLESIPDELK